MGSQHQTPRNRNRPSVPQFVAGVGAGLCASILILAKNEDFENTLFNRKRTAWFSSKRDKFFVISGILCAYKPIASIQVQRKFKAEEDNAKGLYDARHHQDDATGNTDKATLPPYVTLFFEFFDYKQTRVTAQTQLCLKRQRNICLNRSLIGQQAELTSNETAILNDTVAHSSRERDTGDVAGEVVIHEVTQPPQTEGNNTSASSSSKLLSTPNRLSRTTPCRRIAPNDGRYSRNQHSRRYNSPIPFPMSLPPSTGTQSSVNIDRMEYGYQQIAQSINNLAYQQRLRRSVDISNDIVCNVEKRADLICNNADREVIDSYDLLIADLCAERERAQVYNKYFSSQFRNSMLSYRDGNNVSTSEENGNTDDQD